MRTGALRGGLDVPGGAMAALGTVTLTTGRAAGLLLFASVLLAVVACSAAPPAVPPAGQATEVPRPTVTPSAEPFTAARPDIGPVSANPPGGMPTMTEIITVPMAPREAVRAAVKLAQWPAIPQFGTLIRQARRRLWPHPRLPGSLEVLLR